MNVQVGAVYVKTGSGRSFQVGSVYFRVTSTTAVYHPGSDITLGGWTSNSAGALYAAVDEISPSSVEYIQSGLNPSGDVCELKFLNVQTPSSNTGITVSYSIKGDASTVLVVDFVCGSTIIKTWTHNPAPSVYTRYDQALSSVEAATVTNWPDVRLRLTAG